MEMRLAIPVGLGVLLSGCNLYSGLDKPSGNDQLLSAARACFDKGDLTCAQADYSQITGSLTDQATAENSFTYLAQQGASMGAFITFVGNINALGTGGALTQFADALSPGDQSRRLGIWQAYSMSAKIQDPSLQNFAAFISSMALTEEFLAEDESTPGTLAKTDIALDPTACLAAGDCATALVTSGCQQGNGGLTQTATQVLSTSQSPTDTGSPSLDQLYDSIIAAATNLTSLSAGGRLATATSSFNLITSLTVNGTSYRPSATVPIVNHKAARCFRFLMLQQGIGQ